MSLAVYMIDQLVARKVLAMQNLTSLILIGQNEFLSGRDFRPQATLQILSLNAVCMGPTELRLLVQNYPSVKKLYLQKVQGLEFSPDTLCTFLQLRQLHGLGLARLEGMSAASISWMESFFRAQQAIGMAQPRISVACTLDNDQSVCLNVEYMRYPVLCGAEYDERLTSHAQRCWARVAHRSACVVGSVFRTLQKVL